MADYASIDNTGIQEEEETAGFDIRSIITIIYLNWYWIALSLLICFACAKTYLHYTKEVYQAGMKVLIKDSRANFRNNSNINTNALEEMGVISNSNGFDNEMEILKSTAISRRVVKALKLYTSYRMEGRVVDRELYKDTPIFVDITDDDIENLKTTIGMTITRKGKGIHVEGHVGSKGFSKDLAQLPASVETPAGPLMFQQNPGYKMPGDKELYINIIPLITAARAYGSKLITNEGGKVTTTANIRIVETCMPRAIDYLNQLMISYNEDANEDKNEVARKTEQFIGERIEVIRHELDSTEIDLEIYKKSHDLINLANNATMDLSNANGYQKEQVNMQTQLTLVQSLINYIDNPENMREIIPANLGLSNTQLNTIIAEYNELVTKRKRLLKASSEDNATVARVTEQMDDLWPIIGMSLKSLYQDLQIRKSTIDNQYGMFKSRTAETPSQERALNNIGRQQEIKAGLYLMLLQKREQNFISLASTATKARVIDEPRALGKVSPNDKQIIMIACGVGFLVPVLIIWLLSFMSYRIEGREDIERLTTIPILADVPLSSANTEGSNGIVVNENKNNMMEEAFRGLRTNLRFVLTDKEQVVACTSCIPGEGKTFVASNLAVSLSLLNKRVLLIGLDIRKPRLGSMFKLEKHKKGITSFLMLDQPDYELLEDQISYGVVNKNLDILPAGIIPPNPTELISRPLLDDAINYLRTKYDYIVLDTPPIGLVSDTLELARTADATIFVARADYSIKANFGLINSIRKDQKMPKINLVLNGIDLKKKRYGYYYGYGKYSSYGHSGRYGYYGKYSHYGHYGVYGSYRYSSSTEPNT